MRVFNLSVTDVFGFSGPHVDTWTERIDSIVRDLEIVVVVSTGNVPCGLGSRLASGHDVIRGYPAYTLLDEARISEPGVAALALTVGSVARSDGPATPAGATRLGDQAVAPVDGVSPFSRTGPGVHAKAVKPDVVSYGGNWVLNDFGRLDPRNAGVGVVSLSGNGSGRLFDVACGTSFAAPRVARLAADVWHQYPRASANLVRCLVGLAAHQPGVSSQHFPAEADRFRSYGHGLVQRDLALESGGNRVVLYADASMPVDSVAVFSVPIPERFARGRSTRRVRVALAFDPPVRRQRAEYLAGTMDVELFRLASDAPLPDELIAALGTQGDEKVPIIKNRRRCGLEPARTSASASTLQVRTWRPQELNPDDGETYHLAVVHQRRPWADRLNEPYDEQRFAVAVELVDLGRLELPLYTEVRERLRQRIRIRSRIQ